MKTCTDVELETTELSRRQVLARLGLAASVAYVAPALLTLSEAKASGASGGGGGTGGDSADAGGSSASGPSGGDDTADAGTGGTGGGTPPAAAPVIAPTTGGTP